MYKNKKILAVILARGSSKRIPNKNIRLLKGKPLIGWTIEAAQKSEYIDKIVVSSDSDKILNIAKKYGITLLKRPRYLATDNASGESAIMHLLTSLNLHQKIAYDYLILLQPTSPLRTGKHIDTALKKLDRNIKADSLVSVYVPQFKPFWLQTVKAGFLISFLSPNQFNQPLFIPNGAIFISKIESFLKQKTFYQTKTDYYLMSESESVDIDTEFNFKLAEKLLS